MRRGGRVVLRVLDGVDLSPTGSGMPGGAIIQTLLNWMAQTALWASLGSMLIGAAAYGLSQRMGHGQGAATGKTMAIAGAVGAVLVGVAPTAINALYTASS